MDFKTNKPIYQQIVDFCFSKILTREWRAEERVVSVRELSTQLAVNSRTVLKAYDTSRQRASSTRNGEWGSTSPKMR
jgi:GntR family transcriptional regulator